MNTPGPERSATRLTRLAALLVVVVACWQGRGTVEFDFVEHDDGINIVFNPYLGPWSRETLAWALGDVNTMRRYVPLGWLGLAGVYGFSGLAPAGYHVANVVLHLVNSGLVFALVLALVRRFSAGVDDRWRVGAALIGAMGWSLHPFRAETVGWASGLLYGQAGCLALLSVLAYLRAWAPGAVRPWWVGVATLLYGAAGLTYPMCLGTLGIFVLLDLAHRPARPEIAIRRLLAEKLILALPFFAMLAVTFLASHHAPAYWPRPPGLAEFGLGARLLQAAAAWAYYLWKPWWPVDLTPVPTGLFNLDSLRPWAIASLAGVSVVSLALAAGWRRWRGAALLWGAHICLLGPLLGFTERPYFPADRYHYLAGVVLAVAVALVVVRVAGRARIAVWVAAGLGAAGLALAQRAQLRYWQNTDTLMERIVAQAGEEGVRREYRKRWLRFHEQRGRWVQAAGVAEKTGLALASREESAPGGVPLIAALHVRLARDFLRAGRRREAHEHFRAALALAPDWGEAAYNWALLHATQGAALEALRLYRRTKQGLGTPVPLGAQQRLLLLIAESFHATQRPRLAVRTIELALREGGATTEPGLAQDLQARLAVFRAAAGG